MNFRTLFRDRMTGGEKSCVALQFARFSNMQ